MKFAFPRPVAPEKSFAFLLAGLAALFAFLLLFENLRPQWLDLAIAFAAALGALAIALSFLLDSRTGRWLRLLSLAAFLIYAIADGSEIYLERLGRLAEPENFDDAAILLALLLLIFWPGRGDAPGGGLRRLVLLGIFLQGAEFFFDQIDDRFIAGYLPAALAWEKATDYLFFLAMECYLLAAFGFLFYFRRREMGAIGDPATIGDFGRYIFVKSDLFRRLRSPRFLPILWPGGRAFFNGLLFAAFYFRLAPAVKAESGKGYARQMSEIFLLIIRHGLDPQSYYMFDLHRPGGLALAGGYLTRYETKNGLFSAVNRLLAGERAPLGDKLDFHDWCRARSLPAIPIFALVTAEDFASLDSGFTEWPGGYFLKPRHGKGARHALFYRRMEAGWRSPEGRVIARAADLPAAFRAAAEGDAMILQPALVNHPALADLAQDSLIAIRVITSLDAEGRPLISHAMLRILAKLEPSWHSAVEYGAAIDIESGRLGRLTGDKPQAFRWWRDHPVTGAAILDREVPDWPAIAALALRAHQASAGRWVIGWDIAATPEGPRLIEGNSLPDVEFLQRVSAAPIGQSRMAPPLFAALTRLLAD